MNSSTPLVSVVILTYNQEKSVGRTLDCVLAQQCDFEFEIIIGEDASPSDNTRGVCEDYVAKHPRIIKLLEKASNKGLLKNYDDCLKECRGEYICICAGDDWWHNPNKLQLQMDWMKNNDDTILCYTNYDIYLAKNGATQHNALPLESLNTDNIIDKLLNGFFLPPLTIMYRRSALQYIDLLDYASKGYMAEDLPMYLEMALKGKCQCVNVSTATYTVEGGSISQFNSVEKMERFMLNMRDIKLDFLSAHSDKTKITPLQITELYDRLIFNYAFSFCDIDMMSKYSKKIVNLPMKLKVKLLIFRIKPLLSLYKLYRKR